MHLSLLFCEKCFSPIQYEQFLLKILVFLYFLAGLQLELTLYFLSVYCLIVVTSTVLLMAEKSHVTFCPFCMILETIFTVT